MESGLYYNILICIEWLRFQAQPERKHMIIREMKRALFSKSFIAACMAGLAMLVLGGWDYVAGYFHGLVLPGTYTEKFLISYGYGTMSLMAVLFPIQALLPYAMSYRKETDSGFCYLLILKSTRRQYYLGKLAGVACSAFLAFVIPCFLWYLVCCFVLKTGSTEFSIIYGIDFAKDLFKTSPFAYGMIYVGNAGIQGMVFAILGLGLSAVIRNRYLAALLPFCFCMFSASVLDSYDRGLNALSLFVPGQYRSEAVGYWGILLYDAVLLCLGAGLFFKGVWHEGKN